jgi:hypothetical protein
MKKLLTLAVLIAAITATALVPVSASADTFRYRYCPNGTNNRQYCTVIKVILCVVPDVRGLKTEPASSLLRKHDCKLGTVTSRKIKRARRGTIVSQSPGSCQIRDQGFKVNVVVAK